MRDEMIRRSKLGRRDRKMAKEEWRKRKEGTGGFLRGKRWWWLRGEVEGKDSSRRH